MQYYKSRGGNWETLIRNLDREAVQRKTNPPKNDTTPRPSSGTMDTPKPLTAKEKLLNSRKPSPTKPTTKKLESAPQAKPSKPLTIKKESATIGDMENTKLDISKKVDPYRINYEVKE